MRGEDGGLASRPFLPESRLQRLELRLRLLERRVERLPLEPGVIGVLDDAKLLVPHLQHIADRDTGRGGNADEHVRILRPRRPRDAGRSGAGVVSGRAGVLAQAVEDQLRQCPHGLVRIRARRDKLDAIAARNLEAHDADDAPRIHLVVATPQPDVGRELLRTAGEDRGGTRVQARSIDDLERP